MSKLTYDPISGKFFWNTPSGRWGRIPTGTEAGCTKANGYVVINLDGELKYAHRLVFDFEGGIPQGMEVDHINGDRSDNRRSNLRLVDSAQNKWNTSKCSTNTSGIKGVHFDSGSGKWRARFRHRGRFINVGLFSTSEEAGEAVAKARAELRGEYDRLFNEV